MATLHQDFEHGRDDYPRASGHNIPDDSPDTVIPGYPGRKGPGAKYIHEHMTRDEAERIHIAVGLALGNMPVEKRPIGEGFSILVPAEWWRDNHKGVKEILGKPRR